MEEVKQLFRKKKKWGKEEWIILILAGVFLMIVFFPASNKKEKTEGNIFEQDKSKEQFEKDSESTYKEQMEKQLEEVLESIDGIDVVNVMITYKESEEDVVLFESEYVNETTKEEDSQGGNRTIESESTKDSVCFTETEGESKGPYVTHTIAPKVEGVLIVVGGSKAGSIRTQIVRAVQALFDVESHKVVVIKMKE